MIQRVLIFFLLLISSQYVSASLKVLLCSEGIYYKSANKEIIKVYPGHEVSDSVTVQALSYPAYILFYDTTGKFWENHFDKPLNISSVLKELKITPVKPFSKSLLETSFNLQKKSYLNSRLREIPNKYKTLSHTEINEVLRCPSPNSGIIGKNSSFVDRRVYTLYIHSRKPADPKNLVFIVSDLFEETPDSIQVSEQNSLKYIEMDLTDKKYFTVKNYKCMLADLMVHASLCDVKGLTFMNSEGLEKLEITRKKLKSELPDQNSLAGKFMLALACEDQLCYFDSVELYMQIYKTLSGNEKDFNRKLYYYLVCNYLHQPFE